MNEEEIKQAIESKTQSKNYSIWYIGITDDVDRRKGEHEQEGGNTKFWQDWRANSEAVARKVEEYFLGKDMKGGPGGGEHPIFVYIF